MTSAKQIYLGVRRGTPTPPLPYDAEVEYLESTGTQWIDTGIRVNDDGFVLTCDMVFHESPNSAWATYFGSYTSEPTICTRLIHFNVNKNYMYVGYRREARFQSQVGVAGYAETRCVVTLSYMTIDIFRIADGVTLHVGIRDPQIGDDQSSIKLFGAGFICYGFSITHDGVLVRDFIPVRFTNELGVSEGAMYDRVSGQLFRNAGTGEFKFGTNIAGGGYKWLRYSALRFSRSTRLWKEAA